MDLIKQIISSFGGGVERAYMEDSYVQTGKFLNDQFKITFMGELKLLLDQVLSASLGTRCM